MIADLFYSPAVLFMAAALLIPAIPGRLRPVMMVALPVAAFWMAWRLPNGFHAEIPFLNTSLGFVHIDALSRVFGYIFILISFIAIIFALKVPGVIEHSAGIAYAGGALGVTFAGDWITLYIYWEIMAVASTFLILARQTPKAQEAAFRYILVHVAGGLLLLSGIILILTKTGSASINPLDLSGAESWLIFLGIAVNAAIPPLHPWLQDAYPEATVTGSVFLSAFTTKSAVYVMARTFAGAEILIWLGALMTVIPIFYAVLENDIRRVLAYSLINQVGFMMCGIGIGTPLAINGTVSHAFCHILYKALLFMAAGSVLHMTGRIRCTDLGGLYKTMPFTCLFCIIGAASISAFPLFSGFVSKSMIISAVGHEKIAAVWLILQFASAGVFHHAGIKVPFFMFFGHDSGIRAKEPPAHMMAAMALAAFLCVALGVYPKPLYAILPYPVDYIPYTGAHVMGQLQLLSFGMLAFCLLILSGIYPPELRAIHLDADWVYRKGGRWIYWLADRSLNTLNRLCDALFARWLPQALSRFAQNGPVRVILLVLGTIMPLITASAAYFHIRRGLHETFKTGTVPIGLSAAAACGLVVLLFFLI